MKYMKRALHLCTIMFKNNSQRVKIIFIKKIYLLFYQYHSIIINKCLLKT